MAAAVIDPVDNWLKRLIGETTDTQTENNIVHMHMILCSNIRASTP